MGRHCLLWPFKQGFRSLYPALEGIVGFAFFEGERTYEPPLLNSYGHQQQEWNFLCCPQCIHNTVVQLGLNNFLHQNLTCQINTYKGQKDSFFSTTYVKKGRKKTSDVDLLRCSTGLCPQNHSAWCDPCLQCLLLQLVMSKLQLELVQMRVRMII